MFTARYDLHNQFRLIFEFTLLMNQLSHTHTHTHTYSTGKILSWETLLYVPRQHPRLQHLIQQQSKTANIQALEAEQLSYVVF